ncbi:methionine--tRNA ligase [Buchnera aphidicola]|uniref:methionine--tRNA ligase n=1 Tax=Buchnera aphidicola TaxID=9 RepID=UPI002542D8EF|nr:methionine--tRNA ligase [Buchnera aphidicola]WII23761.1 methionine--tRNA ligase [Buchnera aphidicola (Sipha maydis)]
MMKKNILVTCALPYSNGPIHIGHLLEHIQADIWVRYHKMNKRSVIFICADDTHGTPIMLKSDKMKMKPNDLIKKTFREHFRDLSNFNILYDYYSHTNTKENLFFTKKIFLSLKKKGFIIEKNIFQLYDVLKNIFLPDRLVKGECPKCFSSNQYGDHCDKCGSVYSAQDLLHPRSEISNSIPILKKTKHIFFNLSSFEKTLKNWISSGVCNLQVERKSKEWFKTGLRLWDISRDAPYFGFKIPGYKEKYFYVWLDAPICYISTLKVLSKKRKDICFDEFWKTSHKTSIYHFIGKDIIYFHSLFWPAILEGINFRKPTGIFVHGYVTINNKKMSKSKNFFIKASTWLKHFDSDSLRYYFASKLSSKIHDIDLNIDDFISRINSDIVNKIVNLASRCSTFINKDFNNMLSSFVLQEKIYVFFYNNTKNILSLFKRREFSAVIRSIVEYANFANNYINDMRPWVLSKKNKYDIQIQLICTMGINLFRFLMTWLKPIMPDLSYRSEFFLSTKFSFESLKHPLLNHKILKFFCLYKRINVSRDIFFK